MKGTIQFHDVTPETLPLLHDGLKALSVDLGDAFPLEPGQLHGALFGPHPACHGLLALGADEALLGIALYAPVFSTALGCPGVYVSDLWVAEDARGRALGPSLLGQVGSRAAAMWDAGFLKLFSYRSNLRARAFYARLGFAEQPDEIPLRVSLAALKQN